MQLTTLLLLSLVLALLKPLPLSIRMGVRLVLGTALMVIILLDSSSLAASSYLTISGFLAGVARGNHLLERFSRGVCTSAGVLTFCLILNHPLAGIGLGASASLWAILLGQLAYAFCAGTLLQAGLFEDIVDWKPRLLAIARTATGAWALAAAIRTIA
jgi:hypothetical protein